MPGAGQLRDKDGGMASRKLGEQFLCVKCSVAVRRTSAAQCYCRPCAKIREKELKRRHDRRAWAESPESMREKLRRSYARHRDRRIASAREWRTANPELYKECRRRSRRRPKSVVANRVGCSIRAAIKCRKAGRRWESIVGYTLSDLMEHLERQFQRGMSWENMGAWHIDHIVPLASFTFSGPDDGELKAAWSLTNLRPLWKAENETKRATRLHLL